MLKALIIDDETHCTDRLAHLLEVHCGKSVLLTGCFQSMEDGISAIKNMRPDVVFLDVQLNGKTGFDLLNQCPDRNFDVIFTTAYDTYAVQAFRFSAIDYLLKPIDAGELKEAITRLGGNASAGDMIKKLDNLFYNINSLVGHQKRIAVATMEGLELLPLGDIVRLESSINYTNIFLKDGRKIVVAKTLKQFEELLTALNFCRVHNSHLINLEYISSYKKGKGGIVVMADQSQIEVSTRRKEAFLKKLSAL